jgi:Leucine-rich repeat (LRR) protein
MGVSNGTSNTWYVYNRLNEIEELNLFGNNISGSIPDWIGSLNLLHFLSLTGNELSGELPIGICDLVKLEQLRLYYNSFEGIFSS